MTTVDDVRPAPSTTRSSFGGAMGRLLTARWAVWLLPPAAALAGFGLFAPRFGVHSPSLIDDWFAITYEPRAIHQLVHGHYVSSLVDYGGRYRPAYAVLSYFQWITLGDHGRSTFLPTLFGLARLFFFMAAVGAVTLAVLRGRTSRRRAVVLATFAATLVVWTPGIATSFVRFGVAEPTAFAFVALSLLVMTPAVRSLALEEGGVWRPRPLARLLGGYVLYLFGIYMWEALAAVVVVLPALYYWMLQGAPRPVPRRRKWCVVGLVAVALVAPLLHITGEILVNGHLGAHSGRAGSHSLLTALVAAVLPTVGGALLRPESLLWLLLPFFVVPRCIRSARQGDRMAAVCLAALAAGWLAAYVSYVGADNLSRYYIPWIAALAVAGAWSLSGPLPNQRDLSLVALGLVAITIVVGRPEGLVRNWIRDDQAGSKAIAVAGEAYATGCRVYLVGFPAERAVGIARLIPRSGTSSLTGCDSGSTRAFAVLWPSSMTAAPRGCGPGWQRALTSGRITLLACRDFQQRTRIHTQDAALNQGLSVVRLVRPSHFVPASSLNHFSYHGS